ncbi:MAG TPA: hypothetical protein VFG75_13055 [Gaiella sp.]|nr:hypothetical protein [Gaiella sp.]
MSSDVWTYRATTDLGTNVDVSGYDVEATDGSIGKVDEATYETGRSYLVVDTGPWIFGKKVMLPAGVIRGIDEDDQKVFVDRTKDEIKHAPGYDETQVDDEYRGRLGSYYDSTGDPRSNPSNEGLM